MKIWLSLLGTTLLLSLPSLDVAAQSASDEYVIAFLTDGPSERSQDFADELLAELADLTEGNPRVLIPKDFVRHGAWDPETIKSEAQALLAEPEVDFIVGMGQLTPSVLASLGRYSKPVLVGLVFDPVLQGMPLQGGKSGVKNFSYVTLPFPIARGVQVVNELIEVKKLALLVSSPHADNASLLSPFAKELFGEAFSVQLIPLGFDVAEVFDQLDAETDALYVLPQPQLGAADWKLLWDGAKERGLASFVHIGHEQVQAGALAGVYPDFARELVTKHLAVSIYRTLLGEDPKRFEVALPAAMPRLSINYQTAEALNLRLSWDILLEAEVLNGPRQDSDVVWTLEEVLTNALDANLELEATLFAIEAAKEQSDVVFSALLPSAELALGAMVIDSDRALSRSPEWTANASISVTQMLYRDESWLAADSAELGVLLSELDAERLRLDIVLAATQLYFSRLALEQTLDVNKRAVQRARSYLELAYTQEQAGAATIADVYRWEVELGNARKTLIGTVAQRDLVQQSLNTLMHRPLDERFQLDTATMEEVIETGLLPYLDDPWSYETFVGFAVAEALERSPELARVDAALELKDAELRLAQRAFYVPDVSLSASLDYRFWEAGEGSELVGTPGVPDRLSWSAGLRLSLPLFQGGRRFDTVDQLTAERAQLESVRSAQVQSLERLLRERAVSLFVSSVNVRIDRSNADSSIKARDLVAEAYSRGAATATDLIDAEQNAFTAERVAAASVFAVLRDFVAVERAMGVSSALRSEDETQAMLERLSSYYEQQPQDAR